LTATKVESRSQHGKIVFERLEDVLPELTSENFLGRMAFGDLHANWWNGAGDTYFQEWKITTENEIIWVRVFQKTIDPSLVLVEVSNSKSPPSDYYELRK